MRFFTVIAFLLGTAWLNAQPTVELYLEPENGAIVFERASLAKMEGLSPEHPVVDGEVDEDWLRVKYPGHYIGFVETAEVNDATSFNPGAKLFMRSNTKSAVIALIAPNDRATVIDTAGKWATVDFRGNGRVYYKNPLKFPPSAAPAPAAVVTQATRTAPVTPTAPSSNASAVAVTSIPVAPAATQSGGEIFAFEDPEPIAPPPPAVRQRAAPPPPIATAPRRPAPPPVAYAPQGPATQASQTMRKDVPRSYEGTFKRVSGFDFNWFGPDHNFALDDASGKRIAYVDVTGTLLFSPVESYFDKTVVIEGKPEKIDGTVPILIKAKFMRIKK